MSKYTLRLGILTLVLLLLQVVLFNHLLLFQYFLPILYLYPLFKMPYRSDEENPLITPRLMGAGAYLLYILTLTLVQISTIFLLEFFSTGLLVHTLPYIGGSVVITVLLFMIFDALFMPRRRG